MNSPAVIAELKRIAAESGGELRAVDVVEAARLDTSVLHSHFEWDDSEAAEKWRLHQARNLIRVVVEYIGSGDEAVEARVFVSLAPDRAEDGGGYRSTVAVLSNADYREQLLADAFAEMKVFQQKYRGLRELEAVFSAMRRVNRGTAARNRLGLARQSRHGMAGKG